MFQPIRGFAAVCLPIAGLFLSPLAAAQTYPSRTIRIVIPFAPGTATDNLVRPLADIMTADLKQPVILDNKVGATGQIGADHVAKAAPDGYTLLGGATTVIAANPSLFKQLPYNPRTDFDAVIGLGSIPQVVVLNPAVPATNVAEFVGYAKANQGKLFYGSGTAGNIIPSFVLSDRLGLGMTNVMYRSPPQALTDVIGGRLASCIAAPRRR
jgi:tripartite-type tricarboxylate transporter receptor subunit TctC